MPKKKVAKKTVYKKAPAKAQKTSDKKSRTLSFVIGVVTVIILGLIIFLYSRANNYTQVMGSSSQGTTYSQPQ